MDYDAIDREASCFVVSCKKLTTRFYLTSEGLSTDILGRAHYFRWQDLAENAANSANLEKAWQGFQWEAISVPEAKVLQERKS